MARRLREGTARFVPDPEPPAIATADPAVAAILDNCRIHRLLDGGLRA
jgi:hypothetical protein